VAAYVQRNAPELAPYAADPRLLDLAAIPQVLLQLVAAVRGQTVAPQDLLGDVRQVMAVFIDQLFLYSEQTGNGDPALRPQVRDLLARFAAGLARDHQPGAYVDRAIVARYAGLDPAAPEFARLLDIAADTTILDVAPGGGPVGFDSQHVEDYFALQGSDPATLAAGVASAHPAAVLQSVRLLDQAGVLAQG
jgi:hypothetical protein